MEGEMSVEEDAGEGEVEEEEEGKKNKELQLFSCQWVLSGKKMP